MNQSAVGLLHRLVTSVGIAGKHASPLFFNNTNLTAQDLHFLLQSCTQAIRGIDEEYQLCLEAKGGIGLGCMSTVSAEGSRLAMFIAQGGDLLYSYKAHLLCRQSVS